MGSLNINWGDSNGRKRNEESAKDKAVGDINENPYLDDATKLEHIQAQDDPFTAMIMRRIRYESEWAKQDKENKLEEGRVAQAKANSTAGTQAGRQGSITSTGVSSGIGTAPVTGNTLLGGSKTLLGQ